MPDLDRLYKSLEKLRERSEGYEALDDFAEQSFKRYRHDHLVESLRESVNDVLYRARTHEVNRLFDAEPMVYSTRVRGSYVITIIDAHKFITSGHSDYHQEFLREYDDENHRILYIDEFEERSSILLNAAEEGLLDDLAGFPPYEILHRIIGRHGELLDRIGIQTFNSRIYNGVKVYKQAVKQPFQVVEVTIREIHEALRSGETTCSEIAIAYLTRLVGYEATASLNSIIKFNSNTYARAVELDRDYSETGVLRPLHGIPVILKDNFDTHDIATTAGTIALINSVPPDDAYLVKALRDAGAVILAKSNMDEWAFSPYQTVSSVGGTTSNPYDLERVPAGSSGGTAAAIAANFGVIGLGTDTGNSIRGPSSHCCLVGLRPTIGLTSRDGIIPLYSRNDVGGPMCRTVEDVARVLDVIAGYDPADLLTKRGADNKPESYTRFLDAKELNETRIGVLRQYTEKPTADPEINALFNSAINDLEILGATIIDPFTIPDLDKLTENIWCRTFNTDINRYLKSLGENAPVRTLQQIVEEKNYTELTEAKLRSLLAEDRKCAEVYEDPSNKRLIDAILTAMKKENIQAFIFPTWSNPPRKHGDFSSPAGDNSQQIAPHTGMPAITVPMGFTSQGLPTGLQIVGEHFHEPILLKIAHAYEQATKHRKPPELFPELPFALAVPSAQPRAQTIKIVDEVEF